jgi:hypothetical protein
MHAWVVNNIWKARKATMSEYTKSLLLLKKRLTTNAKDPNK